MAGLLGVRPVLAIESGKLDMVERVRTEKKAWGRVLELALKAAGGQPVERAAVVHVNALAQAERFATLLEQRLTSRQEILFAELTPACRFIPGRDGGVACASD
jgi:fatty acid-binding protein DegV